MWSKADTKNCHRVGEDILSAVQHSHRHLVCLGVVRYLYFSWATMIYVRLDTHSQTVCKRYPDSHSHSVNPWRYRAHVLVNDLLLESALRSPAVGYSPAAHTGKKILGRRVLSRFYQSIRQTSTHAVPGQLFFFRLMCVVMSRPLLMPR